MQQGQCHNVANGDSHQTLQKPSERNARATMEPQTGENRFGVLQGNGNNRSDRS